MLFSLQALDVWAMGITLYCFVFGQVMVFFSIICACILCLAAYWGQELL